jgi:alpha/beta superfamily hydrolase
MRSDIMRTGSLLSGTAGTLPFAVVSAVPVPSTEPVALTCADGVALEAELRVPSSPWAAAILLHPHPRMGGSMRVGVPSVLFDALPGAGVAALRFNFRGVEGSAGTYGGGVAERTDVAAAVDALHPLVEGLPLVLAGWSFGGDVALSVSDARVSGWFGVATPLRVFASASAYVAGADPRPKLLAVPQFDQYCDPACAADRVASWVSTRVEVVPGADHFLAGRLDRVAALCIEFLESLRG